MSEHTVLIQRKLDQELVNKLYLRFNTVLNAEIIEAMLFVFLLWDGVDHSLLWIWFIYNFVLNIFSRILIFCFQQSNDRLENYQKWHNRFIFSVFINGSIWALAGFLSFYAANIKFSLLILFMLTAVAGAANAKLFQNKSSYLAFVGPIYLSMFCVALTMSEYPYKMISLGVIIYITFTTVLAFKSTNVLRRSLWLRFKHRELIKNLSITNLNLTEMNVKLTNEIKMRRKVEKLLQGLATHDQLTKLPNRSLLYAELEKAIVRAYKQHSLVALFFVDLDHFKQVNDTYGHGVGDDLLVLATHRMQAAVRKEDTIARFGGDEFCIVLENVNSIEEVRSKASKVCLEIAKKFSIQHHSIHITASVGVGIYPSDCGDLNSLLKNADIALYLAKKSGRNTLRLFDEKLEYAHEE